MSERSDYIRQQIESGKNKSEIVSSLVEKYQIRRDNARRSVNNVLGTKQFKGQDKDIVVYQQEQIQKLNNKVRKMRVESGGMENMVQQIISEIPSIPPLAPQYKKENTSGKRIYHVAPITDWHIGQCIDPVDVEGINAFNFTIAQRRVSGFANNVIRDAKERRANYIVDKLTIPVLGDMISGNIHKELEVTNEFTVPEAIVKASMLISSFLRKVAPHYSRVDVEYLTDSNHPRLDKKPQAAQAGKNNYEYVIAHMVKSYCADLSNVAIKIHPCHETVISVGGKAFLICHGHGVRSFSGYPWYGVGRKVGKESSQRMNLIMEDLERSKSLGFEKYLFGHFHTPVDTHLWGCFPSLSGTSAYDHQHGRYAPPMQSDFFVRPGRPDFGRNNWDLREHDNNSKLDIGRI